MSLRIDDSRAPVLVIELFGRIEHADVELFLATGERCIARRRPYAFVIVPRGLAVPSYAELKTMLLWMRERRGDLDLWFRAMAVVTDSAVMRGALRGVLLLSPLRAAQRVTDELRDAVAWCEDVLRGSIA